MPLAVDNLSKKSTIKSVTDAISKSIGQCMDEGGRKQDQCVAISYSIARKKTGRRLKK